VDDRGVVLVKGGSPGSIMPPGVVNPTPRQAGSGGGGSGGSGGAGGSITGPAGAGTPLEASPGEDGYFFTTLQDAITVF
jgi:hypothetical protein